MAYRLYKEVLMKDADDAKVGELEDSIHDPHEVGQDVRTRVPRSHQHRHISRALMIGENEGSSAAAGDWLVPGLDNCGRNDQTVGKS